MSRKYSIFRIYLEILCPFQLTAVSLLSDFCYSTIIHTSSLLNKTVIYFHSSSILIHVKFTRIVNFVLWLPLFNMSGKPVKLQWWPSIPVLSWTPTLSHETEARIIVQRSTQWEYFLSLLFSCPSLSEATVSCHSCSACTYNPSQQICINHGSHHILPLLPTPHEKPVWLSYPRQYALYENSCILLR